MGLRLNSFLGCWRLETGGKVIGWISLVSSGLLLIFFMLGFGFFSVTFEALYSKSETIINRKKILDLQDIEINLEVLKHAALSLFSMIFMIGSIFSFYYSHLFLQGVNERNSKKVKNFMLMNIWMNLHPLALLLWGDHIELLSLVIGIYTCLIIYSLYSQFAEEEALRLAHADGNTGRQHFNGDQVQLTFGNPLTSPSCPAYAKFGSGPPSGVNY